MKTVFIYALKEPDTGLIRYVGKAADPVFRLNRHLFRAKKNLEGNHKNCWIRSLLDRGVEPVLEIIDETSESDWPMVEAAYIQFYREAGCDLVNATDGGEGVTMTAETRKKIGDSSRITSKGNKNSVGREVSLETREKMRLARVGMVLSASHREAIGRSNRGRKHTSEARANMSAAAIIRCAGKQVL